MTSPQEKYNELLALTKAYLQGEFKPGSWISTDAETFQHFKSYALQMQRKGQTAVHAPPSPAQSRPVSTVQPLRPVAPTPTPPVPAESPQYLPVDEAPPKNVQEQILQPAPIEELPKKAPKETTKGFMLEPMQEGSTVDYAELKSIFTEKFPAVPWRDTPPQDTAAQEPLKRKDPEVIILSYNESGKGLAFIHNMGRALRVLVGHVEIVPAVNIEKNGQWEELMKNKSLRLIITGYAGAQSTPGLMKHFKESTKQGRHFLGKIPICLLSDIDIYLREPHLKLPLWQSIQTLLLDGK